MESDRENSPASSSVSSFSRRVIGIESNKIIGRHPPVSNEMDSSDSTDSEPSSSLSRASPIQTSAREYDDLDESSINRIPPEVLLLIFSYIQHKPDLVPLLTVCRRWADLLVELIWFRPSLMDERALAGIYKVMAKDRTQTHWDYRRYIRRLNLSFVYDKVDDQFLGSFAGSVNLERLTLVNCSKVSHKPIVAILQGCEKLQSIDMTGVKDITDGILDALANNCPRLQGLYAPGCPKLTNEKLLKTISNCPMLKRVKISDCANLNDETILHLTESCKFLIEVDVHNCPNMTDQSLQKLFYELEQLREFRISHNPNISDLLFRSIPETITLERLRIIDLTGCLRVTDRAVESIVQYAPRLRNVVLSKCLNVTDSSLRSLATLGKSLHYIHLGHCSSITDYGVTTLIKNCHRLQYIDLACCAQLTNLSLVELANLPRLTRIGLVKCANINDAGILALIQRRGYDDSLQRIHLSYCTNIGLYPIFQLLQSCPRLTHLSLTGISAFLRPDITRFCRPPPEDFTSHQKSLFCVFSGQGVTLLRDYMTRLFIAPHSLAVQHVNHGPLEPGGPEEMVQRNMQNMQNIQRFHQFFRGARPEEVNFLPQAVAAPQQQGAVQAPQGPVPDEDEMMEDSD